MGGCSSPGAASWDGGVRDSGARDLAFEVLAEADRLTDQALWPGFTTRDIPVAVYTGATTLLFRHPSPPQGFREVPEDARAREHPGRHPAVVANTSAEIGGVRTATVLLTRAPPSLRVAAGLLVHEAFHVFQRERHPGWTANEADLFTYPVAAAEPLAVRRLEMQALRRAVTSRDEEGLRCWTRAALRLRALRFSEMPPEAAAYERGTEMNEGLARYVEFRALEAESPDGVLPAGGFPASAVRERGYSTGLALALLLDRLAPDWPLRLEDEPGLSLEALLREALGDDPSPACGFTASEEERARSAAHEDVLELRARREQRLRDFRGREGWTIVVSAAGDPLSPRGFDPLNVDVVAPGLVLHDRFLHLGNGVAAVEIMGRAALTEAAGEHPLFGGVRSLSVTGLSGEPVITEAEDLTRIEADGVTIEFSQGDVVRSGRAIRVRIGPTPHQSAASSTAPGPGQPASDTPLREARRSTRRGGRMSPPVSLSPAAAGFPSSRPGSAAAPRTTVGRRPRRRASPR